MTWQQPQIMLDNADLIAETDASWQALVGWASTHDPTPPIMARGPVLVRVANGELATITEVGVREMLAYAARFGTSTQNNPFVPRYPPMDHARTILERDAGAEYAGSSFRRVELVTDTPVLIDGGGGRGVVITDPGLHDSGVWYAPSLDLDGVQRFTLDHTDQDEVTTARDFLLDKLLGDFDFADDSSRANALSLVLLPFVREYIGNAPTPLYAVMAPQPGSGKTTLVETCLSPGLGSIAVSAEPRDDEELRKKITSELIAGRRAIFFDNLGNSLASTTLAAAVTSTRWTDRVLGKSTTVDIKNRLIWVATGNNVDPTEELRDRICLVHLEAPDGVPARKRPRSSWRTPNIRQWVLENRSQVVAACMTLVLNWHAADRDELDIPTMGSFERWSEVMGGILDAARVPGFIANRDSLDVLDLDDQEATAFFIELYCWSDGAEFTTRDAASQCQPTGRLYEFVPNSVGPLGGTHPSHRLSRWLSRNRDAVYGDLRLRTRKAEGGLAVWRVEKISRPDR